MCSDLLGENESGTNSSETDVSPELLRADHAKAVCSSRRAISSSGSLTSSVSNKQLVAFSLDDLRPWIVIFVNTMPKPISGRPLLLSLAAAGKRDPSSLS